MPSPANRTWLSIAGLVVLGIVAAVLGVAALLQNRAPVSAEPAAPRPAVTQSQAPSPELPAPSPSASGPEPSVTESVEPTVSASEAPTQSPQKVVVIGDSYSVGDPSSTWIGAATQGLGWGEVVNLSSPGRGFVAKARSCDFTPCSNFEGSIPLIVKAKPDVVVTFGGAADGDYDIKDAAASYFSALRKALPDARIVALSPISTDAQAPYWITLHQKSIKAAVEAVGGTLVDVGQPALGDGKKPSAKAQQQIADKVVAQLEAG